MRRPFLVLAAVIAAVTLNLPGRASAQFAGGGGLGADPFSLYFGYYLPHAAYMAAQPTPLDTINASIAQRQYTASTDRSTLYDPISPYGDEDADPLRPYGSTKGGIERPKSQLGFTYGNSNNISRGNGPAFYYNRTARYFPSMRTGRGPNQNLAQTRAPVRTGGYRNPAAGGGGGGMGMGMGMMGMPSFGPR